MIVTTYIEADENHQEKGKRSADKEKRADKRVELILYIYV